MIALDLRLVPVAWFVTVAATTACLAHDAYGGRGGPGGLARGGGGAGVGVAASARRLLRTAAVVALLVAIAALAAGGLAGLCGVPFTSASSLAYFLFMVRLPLPSPAAPSGAHARPLGWVLIPLLLPSSTRASAPTI